MQGAINERSIRSHHWKLVLSLGDHVCQLSQEFTSGMCLKSQKMTSMRLF
jgi:hypothetical protein